jgi:hypothetical protein
MVRGSTPATAVATMRASGVKPNSLTARSEASSKAHAPSLIPDELPAVTLPLPSVRNAGLSLLSASRVESGRGNSSCANRRPGSPREAPGTATGTISDWNRQRCWLAAVFCCDQRANWSWSARLIPLSVATFSAVWPIESTP